MAASWMPASYMAASLMAASSMVVIFTDFGQVKKGCHFTDFGQVNFLPEKTLLGETRCLSNFLGSFDVKVWLLLIWLL